MTITREVAVEVLTDQLAVLPKKDQAFASSLLSQLKSKGKLTDKQWPWVIKMAEATMIPKLEPRKVQIGSMAGLIALFAKAKEHGLKFPQIKLAIVSHGRTYPVTMKQCGSQSKHPGAISVSEGGYGSTWYGWVHTNGSWETSKSVSIELQAPLTTLLQGMSQDPAKTANEYGKLTGHCCFCSLPLSDPKSKSVGYGKTCAKKYGLPYGEATQFMKTLQEA